MDSTVEGMVCLGSSSLDTMSPFPLSVVSQADLVLGAARQAAGGAAAPVSELDSIAVRVCSKDLPPVCNTGVGELAGVVDVESYAINSALFEDAPELFAAGTDYVRLTCNNRDAAEELANRMRALGERFAEDGNYLDEHAYVLGYRGWACGPVFYGERPDGVMVQGSSVGSDMVLPLTLDLPVHSTRIDLQLTLKYRRDRADVGRLVANEHHAWRELQKASGRMVPRPPRLIDGYGAGDSCLIGARASEAFGRCYDKHRESCDKYRDRVNKFRERVGVYPLGTWRFEVEYKGSQAEQVYERLAASGSYGGVAVGNVKRWYEDRGVLVPVGADAVPPVQTIRQRSDVDRSLAWLRDQVSPTVVKLMDLGYRDEVLKALGLAPLFARAEEK